MELTNSQVSGLPDDDGSSLPLAREDEGTSKTERHNEDNLPLTGEDEKRKSGRSKTDDISAFRGFPSPAAIHNRESQKKSSSQRSEMSRARQTLQLQLEATRKIAQLEEEKMKRQKELIDLELQLNLNKLNTEASNVDDFVDNVEEEKERKIKINSGKQSERSALSKVNSWLNKNQLDEKPVDNQKPFNSCLQRDDGDNQKLTMNKNLETFLVRQTQKVDLPLFSGEPEEWAMFSSHFHNSTRKCNYTNEENISRLQKCLRGKARDAVKPLLTTSSSVGEIMDTLEMLFGRKEIILAALIEKVKKTVSLKDGRSEFLIHFSNNVSNLTTTIETLNARNHLMNPCLMEELVRKLPYFLKMEWGAHVLESEELNLKDFANWLRQKAKISCLVGTSACVSKYEEAKKQPQNNNYKKKETVGVVNKAKPTCPLCSGSHKIADCDEFLKKEVDQRWEVVTKNNLCFCCLTGNHRQHMCRKKKECGVDSCKRNHNSLLHKQDVKNQETPETEPKVDQIGIEKVSVVKRYKNSEVLLKILPIKIYRSNGQAIKTYAFFDEGATVSLIDSKLAKCLNVSGQMEPVCYQWVNGITHEDNDSEIISLDVSAINSDHKLRLNGIRTISKIELPTQTVDVEALKEEFPDIPELRQLQSFCEERPLLLIGQDNVQVTIAKKVLELTPSGPLLSKTRLGWVLHGKNSSSKGRENIRHFLYHLCNAENSDAGSDANLHELVRSSFSTENFGVKFQSNNEIRNREDQRCVTIMENTLKRCGSRFEVGLLWRKDNTEFPDSKMNAFHRLRCMERKMDKEEIFAKKYCAKIEDYLQKGYARKLGPEELEKKNGKAWYLPHFGVINANKPDKLRLVFDAAAKTDGLSLNTELLQGPDLLTSLISVLLKFRRYRIAFVGDIKEMFHQVRIIKEDRAAQRFLWRGLRRSGEPDEYEMQVMTFGATCSPCLAQFVKNRNAEEHRENFPEAYEAISKKHYVDDYLDSKKSEDQAIKCIDDVIKVHRNGGFEICNFICNSEEVYSSIPEDLRCTKAKNFAEHNSEVVERVLGLQWKPKEDCFIFPLKLKKVNPALIEGTKTPTKREMLKFVMSIFDPLGFLSNILTTGKIILQEVWRIGLGWDQEVPLDLFDCWKFWLKCLKDVIFNLNIPRCYGKGLADSDEVELHGFCDASDKAFAATVYIRFRIGTTYETALVIAKSRVAPLKNLSIPRLELQAALLLCRLMNMVLENIDLPIVRKFYWTDSKIVLHWIKVENCRFKVFVAQRIAEILELSSPTEWYWVPTKENVADEATKVLKNKNYNCKRWFSGPDFLKGNIEEYCRDLPEMDPTEMEHKELEIKKLLFIATQKPSVLPDAKEFSSYEKLVRTTAWVLRFVKILTKGQTERKSQNLLTVEEIEQAEEIWFKKVQNDYYSEDIRNLKQSIQLKKVSKLYPLSPYFDQNGVIRMKGRINNDMQMNRGDPIILPAPHDFTKLLIQNYHTQARHQGYEHIINEVRQKFWIQGLRNAAKKIHMECQLCKNRRAQPLNPEIGMLPEARLAIFEKPFSKTGVDYFGPMNVTIGRRHEKRYGAIFTCLTTRAIHLEIAGSLSTDSFIMALRRFIARRGRVTDLYSDNGTNFHGANNELNENLKSLDQDKIWEELSVKRIRWHFNCPTAAHMGGSWERLIRSIKKIMGVTLKEEFPKEEVLQTALAEIESILNSRPLTYVPVDPEAPECLTPNHFLIGMTNNYLPGDELQSDLKKQWKWAQRISNDFWKRWLKEYLPELNRRRKWLTSTQNLKEDDIVLVVDSNLPRKSWPLGRITKTFPGKSDGIVRVVEVKTSTGLYRQPVNKLCKLEVRKGDV